MRQLAAETRYLVNRRTQQLLDRVLDRVLGSLIGRELSYRLVDDVVRYLIANPPVHPQGAYLTDEVIDETRQYLFQADAVVDQMVSSARSRPHMRKSRQHRPRERSR
jgi:hypothetical protein